MYCSKCGKENADDAVYCQKCGTLLEAEDETRVATRGLPPRVLRSADTSADQGGEPEGKIFSITPTVKFVIAGYVAAIFAAFLIVAVFSFIPAVSPLIAAGVGLLTLLVPAYFHLKKKLVRYTLTDTTIEIDRGLISRTTQNIPLRRVQDVTVSATLMQRMLGFGDIMIDNASEDGGKVILDDIDSPRKYADLVLKQMRLLDR